MKINYNGFLYESIDEDDEDLEDNSSVDLDDEDEEEYDPDEDDPHPINKIVQDNEHKYQYLNGVKYRLGYSGNDFAIEIERVEETVENMFYPDMITKYEKYISEGGIIDSFPVRGSPLAYDLEGMCSFISENYSNDAYEDDIDEMLSGSPFQHDPFNIDNITIYNDEPDEQYYMYRRLNDKARSVNEMFPAEDRTEDELKLMEVFTKIFTYFQENKEWTLTDMNHRFQAVKNLGVSVVMVEPV